MRSIYRGWRPASLALAASVSLAGCGLKPPAFLDFSATGSTTPARAAQKPAPLADRYNLDPDNRDNAIAYATALWQDGRAAQAVTVMERASQRYPGDRAVMAAYGKALAAQGSLPEALEKIRDAGSPDQPDWRLLSAEAAVLDQMGENTAARKLYHQALTLAPNQPSVLANLGLSHAMTGDLAEAEKMLRRAVAQPGADSKVRQNLALIVGLRGRYDEAERLARSELSPDLASANTAYVKTVLASSRARPNLRKAAAR